MRPIETYTNERLDHLSIVASVCQEIGLANYLMLFAGIALLCPLYQHNCTIPH